MVLYSNFLGNNFPRLVLATCWHPAEHLIGLSYDLKTIEKEYIRIPYWKLILHTNSTKLDYTRPQNIISMPKYKITRIK